MVDFVESASWLNPGCALSTGVLRLKPPKTQIYCWIGISFSLKLTLPSLYLMPSNVKRQKLLCASIVRRARKCEGGYVCVLFMFIYLDIMHFSLSTLDDAVYHSFKYRSKRV